MRVFFGREELAAGESWLLNIADSLDGSRRVAPLYTPTGRALTAKMSLPRHIFVRRTRDAQYSFPSTFRSADIPSLFRTVQFADCREGDAKKLADACRALCKTLN